MDSLAQIPGPQSVCFRLVLEPELFARALVRILSRSVNLDSGSFRDIVHPISTSEIVLCVPEHTRLTSEPIKRHNLLRDFSSRQSIAEGKLMLFGR